MKRVILASQSPRRKELLSLMGVEFETIPSNYEESLDDSRSPEEVAKELALGKAMDVARNHPDAYVIGSDTIVTIDGRQLEKPRDEEDAHDMLKLLSGRTNYVTTGIAVVYLNDKVELTDADTVAVHFNDYDERAVREYVATGDPMDKAGAYAVQKLLGTMISHYDGDIDTIVGLPTRPLAKLLNACDIEAKAVSDLDLPVL